MLQSPRGACFFLVFAHNAETEVILKFISCNLFFLFAIGLLSFFMTGCDRPECSPKDYGVIVSRLPQIQPAPNMYGIPTKGEIDAADKLDTTDLSK